VVAIPWYANKSAVISAGMMPGLTGLLPRLLAADIPGARRLTGWVGGRDRFTVTAALDYLASAGSFGQAFAVWRDGRRVPDGTGPRGGVGVPFFPGPVSVSPFLSTEIERLVSALRIPEAAWYSVFDGEHLWQALSQSGGTPPERAPIVSRAADLDLFGAAPYQLVVVELAGDGRTETVVLRGSGASRLTGLTAALATRAVLDGTVPPGVHHAADVLRPQWTVDELCGSGGVSVERYPGPADRYALVEEGAL
jgi:hypothetical protein